MPHLLKKGETIGIAAPASPFNQDWFHQGVGALKKLGFEIYYRDDIFSQERYLAGSDERRAEELTALFTKKEIRAILFARGGYGSQRIISRLEREILQKDPKPVIGFSDLTPLLTFLRQEVRMPVAYGPVVTQLGNHPSPRTLDSLQTHLTGRGPHPPIDLGKTTMIQDGKATGPLVGGCLSLIASSMGTVYELETDGTILFLEDTDEKVFAIDRMLTQLKDAGKLKNVKGMVFGSLNRREKETHSVEEMLNDVLKDFSGPVITGFPAGHSHDFVTLPLGPSVTLDTGKKRFQFNEPFLS